MSIELWEQGVIIEFSNNTPCHRAMVRTVGKVEIGWCIKKYAKKKQVEF